MVFYKVSNSSCSTSLSKTLYWVKKAIFRPPYNLTPPTFTWFIKFWNEKKIPYVLLDIILWTSRSKSEKLGYSIKPRYWTSENHQTYKGQFWLEKFIEKRFKASFQNIKIAGTGPALLQSALLCVVPNNRESKKWTKTRLIELKFIFAHFSALIVGKMV